MKYLILFINKPKNNNSKSHPMCQQSLVKDFVDNFLKVDFLSNDYFCMFIFPNFQIKSTYIN